MNIEQRDISTIKPYEKNAKEHTKKQIQQISNSIQEFGFNQPIVVDNEGIIIVGHGRYHAANHLEMKTVPVLEVDLPEEKAKAYRLADNKLNESDWDMGLVVEELKSLSLQMVDLTGFNADLVLETQEDEFKPFTSTEPVTKEGDIYILGDHKLICGDSTKAETYEKLLGDEKPRLIFTDPPYSVDYKSPPGKSYNSEAYGGTGGRIFNDDKNPEDATVFYTDILKQLYDFSADDVTIYWWYANSMFNENLQAFANTEWHYSQTVFWLKEHFVFSMGQLFHRIYEPCMVGWKNGHKHHVNGEFSTFSEWWTLDKKTFQDYIDAWYVKRDKTNEYIHPTQKPVQLAERALKRSSEEGDIVLDAFGGSGSTMIACDQLKRKTMLIELDPKFCDAIVNRWVQYKKDGNIIKNGNSETWNIE